ncbi:MAG: isoprenylcysteine carboxylmethyltransferase family protein [Ktedonobacteraceae bacterium]
MQQEFADKPGVVAPPPLIYAIAFLASLLLHARKPLPFLPALPRNVLGASLIGAAGTIIFFAAREMRRAGTNINPELPATALVSAGPYQFTRNPLYLSLTLLYAGLTTLFNTLWGILLLPTLLLIMQRGVIQREERYLEGKFGATYTEYKARVRRWL